MTLFGPVFQKELIELSRRRSTYLLRALAGLGLLFVVFVFANETGMTAFLSTARKQAGIAQNVFENWAWFQWWIICGVMPLLTCGLVAAERESGALPLLFTTHLTNREIILGKLASRLVTVFLLSFSALPVLVLLGLLGGIDLDRLFKIYLMTLSAAALAASIGMYLSTTAKRPWVACIQTYATLAVLWGFTPFASVFGYMLYLNATGAAAGGPNRDFIPYVFAMAPYLPIYFLTDHQAMFRLPSVTDWPNISTFVSFWLAASAVFLFLAMRALRKDLKASFFTRTTFAVASFVLRPFKNAATKRFGIESALFWRLRFAGFAIFEGNPIVWRDRRADVYDPDGNVLRLQVLLWIFAAPMGLLFVAMAGTRDGGLFGWLLAVEIALLHIMLAVVGASSIARERQRGSLDVMLLSKMPSWSIIVGTIQGVFWTCTPTLILIAATLALRVWNSGSYFGSEFALRFILLLLCYSAVIVVGSIVISAASASPNRAIAAAIVITLVHWFWPLPVGSGWAVLTGDQHFDQGGYIVFTLCFYMALILGAMVAGARLLATDRAFPAAVTFVATIPALLLFVAPNPDGISDGTLLLRWVVSANSSSWNNPTFHSERADQIARLTTIMYFLSTAMMLAFAAWKGDRLFGRMQARQRPAVKPPFEGRITPAVGSNSPIPMNAVS